jgi:hypothetical protein
MLYALSLVSAFSQSESNLKIQSASSLLLLSSIYLVVNFLTKVGVRVVIQELCLVISRRQSPGEVG